MRLRRPTQAPICGTPRVAKRASPSPNVLSDMLSFLNHRAELSRGIMCIELAACFL